MSVYPASLTTASELLRLVSPTGAHVPAATVNVAGKGRVVVILAADYSPLSAHLLTEVATDTQPFQVSVSAGPATGPGLQVPCGSSSCGF